MKNYCIIYQLSMPNPNTHYFEVEMDVDLLNTTYTFQNTSFIDFKLPVWTPGSYLVREYAKNIEGFTAFSGNNILKSLKIDKNTWRIIKGKNTSLKIKYKVYAYELTVRTSFLDDSHGYANGASVFMYIPQLMNEKYALQITPHDSFEKVSLALPLIGKNKYEVENYDLLVDSPIEIGNQEIIEFEAMGIKHTIANYSMDKLIYDKNKLIEDYKKVVIAASTVIGDKHPCKEYLFIIHHLPGIGGGLEHLNSTSCQTSPDVYQNAEKYIGFLGLIAHEYFHLWNVKRIRPKALGPFDYDKENYSNMLWVSEGFTSFYQEDILRRAGIIDENSFLRRCSIKIGTIENSPGNKVQSATEASWDAWIKFYRPNENSNNSTISYYTKGGVLAIVLNCIIIDATNGQKSLDDVFKLIWNTHYLKENRGYTDDEFLKACEKVAEIDLKTFFEDHIYGTKTIEYEKYFHKIGINFTSEIANKNTPWVGAEINNRIVTRVEKGSGSYENGINVNDEIISINGKIYNEPDDFIKNKKVGDEIKVKVFRSGKVLDYTILLVQNPKIRIELKPNETNLFKYKRFMHL